MAKDKAGVSSPQAAVGHALAPTPSAAGAASSSTAAAKKQPEQPELKDSLREVVETVVFVVVLVLLLKSFVAEAFVIPTGSMAETLYGYQKLVKCPECSEQFPVNCSEEAEKGTNPIVGCDCPNCRARIDIKEPPPWDLRKLLVLAAGAFLGGLGISRLAHVLTGKGLSSQAQFSPQVFGTAVVGGVLWLWMFGTPGSRSIAAEQGGGREHPMVMAGCNSGDRVLVAKFLWDSHLRKPERFDVVVFKFPEEPQHQQVPKNYIK